MPTLETVKQWETFYENKSLYYHPEKRFDSYGRPTSSQSYDFSEPQEYLRKLLSKRRDAFGPLGLLEQAKEELREAKNRWKYYCEHGRIIDPKTPPKGDFAKEINRLTGKKKVLEKEARILNGWLAEKESEKSDQLSKLQRKYQGQGFCKNGSQGIVRCDYRDVEYKEGKPFFVDDGGSVDEYKANCKAEKLAKARAAAKVLKMENEQAKRDRKNKIESRKIAIDEQLQKLRRRQATA